MIASLPMYDRPETRAANDRIWRLIRDHLPAEMNAPADLSRDSDPWQDWQSPKLLLSQTCGYPFRAKLHSKTRLVATPVHNLPDCPPGHYHSVVIARKSDPRRAFEDFASARLAYNEPLSQSGWAAVHAHAATSGFQFTQALRTGSHRASAEAVARGAAEIAAIDAVSWAMMRRWDSFTTDLKEIAVTAPTPALPYITSAQGPAPALAEAISHAIAELSAQDRATLLLDGLADIPAEAYLAVPCPPTPPDTPH
ncbi:MAG: PhnD/SsuA/transferrin family substrate-binding protein [Paracoccaceae bacterium]